MHLRSGQTAGPTDCTGQSSWPSRVSFLWTGSALLKNLFIVQDQENVQTKLFNWRVVTSKCAHARHVVCIIECVISTDRRYIFTADQILFLFSVEFKAVNLGVEMKNLCQKFYENFLIHHILLPGKDGISSKVAYNSYICWKIYTVNPSLLFAY